MSIILANISLRAWHPVLTADEISGRLELPAKFAHNVSEPRRTPSGGALSGHYDMSYASMPLIRKEAIELDEELSRWCEVLENRERTLREIFSSGGKVEFYVSLFVSGLGGFELEQGLLAKIGAMGLGLSVEIYPE